MISINTTLSKFIYTDDLPLEVRMTNIVYFTGFVASFLLAIVHVIMRTNIILVLVVVSINISFIIIILLSNYFCWYKAARRLMIFAVCYVFFPAIFFSLGGLESSMAAYFVLSLVIIFLLSSGMVRNILLVLHTLEASLCYYLSTLPFFAPFVARVKNPYVDAILAFVAVSLCIGIIVTIQKKLFIIESEKALSARDDLFYRGKLLRVVNQAAELLLYEGTKSGGNFENAMEIMARCISADRMYIWQNREMGGKRYYFQEYEWVSNNMENSLRIKTGHPYLEAIPVWEETFSRGESINAPVRELSGVEQGVLYSYGILSILVIPIYLQEQFWGFVSFDHCTRERICSAETIAILRSGCLLFANAAVRKSNELTLDARLKQQELMAAISRNFISNEVMSSLIEEALRLMGEFMGVSRILIAVADEESGESHPAYAWCSSESWKPDPSQTGFNDLLSGAFPKTINEKGSVPFFCNDTVNDNGGKYRIFFEKVSVRSFIWAPVYVNHRYWGIISVEQCDLTRTWSESNAQLVDMVSNAVAGAVARDLMEKERSAALKQALEASLAKGNFLSNMSHEMRTPMNAIIGMTSIGKNAGDMEKKNYAFKKIEDASTHLLGVINDILDMSKIEANKLELSPVHFNFEKMLQKVVTVINFRVEERRQIFYVNLDREIPHLLAGDDQRLAQVITNLLSNAVKFTPEEGTIRLNASCVKEESDDTFCMLRVEVIDSGIGISKEQQVRLFNSFVQAETSTTRKYGGTGLGLAISKQIIELMGGTIWIESELGKGASFIFTVRFQRVKEEDKPCKPLLESHINWSNIRLLAVDDDEEVRRYFAGVADGFGITCHTASGAEEALALIEENGGYDIYFIDWQMPGMNGLELGAKIKAGGSKSVVTMISAAAYSEIEDDAKKSGIDKFLSKPVFPSDIVSWINTCLGVPVEDIEDVVTRDEKFSGCVLLAEDVEINREIVLSLLEPAGLVIDCAENGVEAVRMVSENPEKYGMIFMDVQMPEMDGYEATRRIRELEKTWPDHRSLPIIAMTANVFREDIEKSLAAGMNDHIGKPLDFDAVLAKLKKYLPHETVL